MQQERSGAYRKMYEVKRRESAILNPGAYALNETAMMASSKEGLESLLIELMGRPKDGKYFDSTYGGRWVIARIPQAEAAVRLIEGQFAALRERARNEGRRIPESMPADMAAAHDEAQAVLDVRREESRRVRERLKQHVKAEKAREGAILRRGPRGAGVMKGGVLVEVDGQRVGKNGDGELVIDDKRSPYHGMRTADYFEHVVKPWSRRQAKRLDAARREAREKRTPPGELRIGREPLPEWPPEVPRPGTEAKADQPQGEESAG